MILLLDNHHRRVRQSRNIYFGNLSHADVFMANTLYIPVRYIIVIAFYGISKMNSANLNIFVFCGGNVMQSGMESIGFAKATGLSSCSR